MKIIIVTPQGELYNEEVDYVLVSSKTNGEFVIMNDHIPMISTIDEGYVKLVRDNNEIYVVVLSGVLEHSNNIVTVIAQEAHVGLNKDSALAHLHEVRRLRIEENKKRHVDFVQAERELKKNIKKSGAGQV